MKRKRNEVEPEQSFYPLSDEKPSRISNFSLFFFMQLNRKKIKLKF